jgi:GcrA cell cycle regulator
MTWKVPGRVELLRKLWVDGLSARDIAARLGPEVTRNMVISKADRMGLPRRAPTGRKGPRRARALTKPAATPPRPKLQRGFVMADRSARNTRPSLPGTPLPEPQAGDVARIATLDLEVWHCRWPIGDPAEVGATAPLFCGIKKVPGLPYCEVHSRRAFNRPTVSVQEVAAASAHEMEAA